MVDMQILKIVNYKNISKWNVPDLIHKNLSGKYENLSLYNFLERDKTVVNIQDDILYKQITVHQYGEGVSLRCEKKGKEIGTKRQFLAKKGQLIVSGIDARNGSVGLITDYLDGGIVTNDFWLFNLKNVDSKFMQLLLSLEKTSNYMQSKSNGTTNRQRVNIQVFLQIKMPVPPLEQQKVIIQKYNDAIAEAERLERKADEEEIGIDDYIFDLLDINKISLEHKKDVLLNISSFTNMYNWDAKHAILNVSPLTLLKSNKYKNVPIQSQFAINPSTPYPENLTEVTFLPMECISDIYGSVIEKRTINAKTKGYTKFKDNDVIFAKITPCMQNGKCAVVNGLESGYGMGSTEFHVFRSISKESIPEYLHALLRTTILRKAAMNYFTGSSGQQRVSSEFIENLYIPLPPLSVQEEIVSHINEIKANVKSLRKQASDLRTKAKHDFENTVFN